MTQPEGSKAWSGRFEGRVDPTFERYSRSLDFDLRLLPDDVRTNRAWARELHRLGVYTTGQLNAVLDALAEIERDYAKGRLSLLPTDEDVHMLVERLLTEKLGPTGAAIHAGRSRNDQVVTDFKLYLKRSLHELRDGIRFLQGAAVARAGETADWVMPAYTHLQRAQPVTLGHYLLSLFWALERDLRRVEVWFQTHDFCPLGSGACAGSGFPVDRFRLAEELGFKGPTENSIDTVASRDFAVDAVNVCANLMLTLSRYAEDWILWSSREFCWLRVADAYSTGSSMMPQKRNPDSLELVRGKASRVASDAWRLQALLKGLPLIYDRELQEDKEPLFDAMDTTLTSVHVMTGVLSTATFDRDRLAHAVESEMLATDLADYLVLKGVPFREAHRIVAGMVKKAEKSGKPLDTWTLSEFRTYSEGFDSDVQDYLTVAKSLTRRRVYGGTAPESVALQLERARAILAESGEEDGGSEALAE